MRAVAAGLPSMLQAASLSGALRQVALAVTLPEFLGNQALEVPASPNKLR